MRIGWLQDFTFAERPGGAQKAVEQYRAAAPADVEIVPCPPGAVVEGLDSYLTFLVKRYSDADLEYVQRQRFIRCGFDWWPPEDGQAHWRNPLAEKALLNIWMSPLHWQQASLYWKLGDMAGHAVILPPPLDLSLYDAARAAAVGQAGTIWAGEWSWYKGPDLVAAWAQRNHTHVDMYSPSMNADDASKPWVFNTWAHPRGFKPEAEWLETFASYERFIHMSRVPDAFGYVIVEAYLLGLETVVSGRTGVESFDLSLSELAEACGRGAGDFWKAVSAAL